MTPISEKKNEMDFKNENVVKEMNINWTLNRKEFTSTIFHKKKMTEIIDLRKLYGFIKNEMGISYASPKGKLYNTELEHLKKFKDILSKSMDKFQTSHILPKHKWGRVIPNLYLSLCVLHRPTRHSFADDNYIDIDMINAHPTIIYNMCKNISNIENKALKKYIDNPKYYREQIALHHSVDKNIAKQLPIILMFGGSYQTWIKENNVITNDTNKLSEIVDIERELKAVIEIIYSNNPDIKKDVLKQNPKHWKNDDEAKRGVMGLWCQTIERHIQELVIDWLVNNKSFILEEIIPSQDGFMILKKNYYGSIIDDINRIVLEKINLPITFIVKPFDEKFEIPLVEGELSYEELVDLISVKKLADIFLELFEDYIIRFSENLYIYYGDFVDNKIVNNGRWYDETSEKKRHKLTRYISENLYNYLSNIIKSQLIIKAEDKQKLLKDVREHTSRGVFIKDVITHILSKTKITKKDFDTNPFLLGFENGVYDLKNSEFRKYKYDDYMTMTTRYNYVEMDLLNLSEEDNEKALNLNEILNSIMPNTKELEFLLTILASGLDGRAYQKIFMFNGAGGNGKGLINSLMNLVLGDYFHSPTTGILKDIEKSNSASPDIMNLYKKRYLVFAEVKGTLKLQIVRKLSGGDTFTGRLLYGQPVSFKLSSTNIFEFNSNSYPELDGTPEGAEYRRLVNNFFPTNFTEDKSKIGKTIGKITYKKADTKYEGEEWKESHKLLFLTLLLAVYKAKVDRESDRGLIFKIPNSIRERSNKFIENQNRFHKIFNRYWTTSNKDDKIPAKEIWVHIQSTPEYNSFSFVEKKTYGRDAFYKYLEDSFTISGNSKTGKLVSGVEKREFIEEFEAPENDDDEDDEEVEEVADIIDEDDEDDI